MSDSRQCDNPAPPAAAQREKGLIVVISGPSGVGKSTICQRLVSRLPAALSVSATTRTRRRNEVDGRDYYFMDRREFERKIDDNEFAEHAEYDGNLYGTPAGPLRDVVRSGRVALLEIEIQGGTQVRRLFPEAVMIFIEAPSMAALADRLDGRRTDAADTRNRRLQHAQEEIRLAREPGAYQYFVTNDLVDDVVERIVRIVEKERKSR